MANRRDVKRALWAFMGLHGESGTQNDDDVHCTVENQNNNMEEQSESGLVDVDGNGEGLTAASVGGYDEGDLIRKEMAGHCFELRTGNVAGTESMSKAETGVHKLLERAAVEAHRKKREVVSTPLRAAEIKNKLTILKREDPARAKKCLRQLCEILRADHLGDDPWKAISDAMRSSGFSRVGPRVYVKNGGYVGDGEQRTCLANALTSILRHRGAIHADDVDDVQCRVMRYGNDVNACMIDVMTTAKAYGHNVIFVTPPLRVFGLCEVLKMDDEDYIIVWRYVDEDGLHERHATAWMAVERQLVDDRPLIMDITSKDLTKKGVKRVREALFPSGRSIEIDALYMVRPGV